MKPEFMQYNSFTCIGNDYNWGNVTITKNEWCFYCCCCYGAMLLSLKMSGASIAAAVIDLQRTQTN